MVSFAYLITAQEEELLNFCHKVRGENIPMEKRLEKIAQKTQLRTAQLICAIGFNSNASSLPEIFPILGYANFDQLVVERNDIFTTDAYKRLTLENMQNIYTAVKDNPDNLQIMQYLLSRRLDNIEGRIEETVNSMIIEKYKAEMRTIYNDNIANIDFAEERLNKHDSGFRALLNEVSIIIESKLIPAGDIFFRDTILPEEKRRILSKGLIPLELIETRLADENIPAEEKKILNDYLKQNRDDTD